MTADIIAVAAFVATITLLLAPRLRAAPAWRATVTPLASIIGSGFLVSLPLLAVTVGAFAVFAMLALCALAYLLGGVIRFNIARGEKLFDLPRKYPLTASTERLSHLALSFAYFVSVTYYLSLLAAFLLKGFGMVDPAVAKAVTTVLLAAIGGYGLWRGLHALETVEEYAVSLKLAVIAAVLASLAWFNIELFAAGQWRIAAPETKLTTHSAMVLLGLLIVVQGFETSRFLRGEYPPAMRIRTMRAAQLIATAIYGAFFALASVTLDRMPHTGDVAAVTTMLASAAAILPLMLVGGALFAQGSAAIADAIGAAGLIGDITANRVHRNHAYPVIAIVGIAITWAADVFQVIALASRAFAFFYLLQCLVAISVARVAPGVTRRNLRIAGFSLLALLALMAVLFGIPAETE